MKADAREAARLHIAAQIEEADELTRAVQEREKAIGNLLARALVKNRGRSNHDDEILYACKVR